MRRTTRTCRREPTWTRSNCAGARKHLVERRNALIKSLGLSSQNELMEAHMDLIVRIQKVIEVVDGVIEEEAGSQ